MGHCAAQYVAEIWQERWSGSTENYNLEMFARVRSQCGIEEEFETFHASDAITRAMAKPADALTTLLDSCRSDIQIAHFGKR